MLPTDPSPTNDLTYVDGIKAICPTCSQPISVTRDAQGVLHVAKHTVSHHGRLNRAACFASNSPCTQSTTDDAAPAVRAWLETLREELRTADGICERAQEAAQARSEDYKACVRKVREARERMAALGVQDE